MRLRAVLGLRSPVNTALRAWNPWSAPASVQGVFHPPFLALQAEAAALMGGRSLTVLKGGGGEFERHPTKDLALHGLRGGRPWRATAPALEEGARRLADPAPDLGRLAAIRDGLDDSFSRSVVLATAALALETAGAAPEGGGLAMAREVWADRRVTA
jgi:anthranilate phosphoribosyltransferase